MLIVFVRGTLVNKEVTSKETNRYPSLNNGDGIAFIRFTASNESFSMYSFCVRGFSRLLIYFPRL